MQIFNDDPVLKTYVLPFDTSIIDFLIVAGVLLYGRG